MNEEAIMQFLDERFSQIERQLYNTIDKMVDVKTAHLENYTYPYEIDGKDNLMKKIRRPVQINGMTHWISAENEQEYAEKLLLFASNYSLQTDPALTAISLPSTKHNFREYALNWFETFSKPNIRTVTAKIYEQDLRCHILPVLGDIAVEDITVEDVQRVFNQMGNVAKASKQKVKIVLNQILEMAIEQTLLQRNPLHSRSLRITGKQSTETKPYSIEQIRYLAAHLNDLSRDSDRAWLALLISLPLRPEEVLGLRWQDFDPEKRTIYIHCTVTHPDRNMPEFAECTKTDASRRTLVLPESIVPCLGKRGKDKDFIVGGEKPLSYTEVTRMRNRIKRETGFDDKITPRRFRTTVATDISSKTRDLKLVQHMLGHSTPQMTLKHYDKGRSTAVDASTAISEVYGFDAVLPAN